MNKLSPERVAGGGRRGGSEEKKNPNVFSAEHPTRRFIFFVFAVFVKARMHPPLPPPPPRQKESIARAKITDKKSRHGISCCAQNNHDAGTPKTCFSIYQNIILASQPGATRAKMAPLTAKYAVKKNYTTRDSFIIVLHGIFLSQRGSITRYKVPVRVMIAKK